jgi:pheromone shutdown protein TraB
MRESFPGIYQVMMEERNVVMAEALMRLQEDNPDSDIAVFLGAAHKNPVKEILEAEGLEVGSEGRLGKEER